MTTSRWCAVAARGPAAPLPRRSTIHSIIGRVQPWAIESSAPTLIRRRRSDGSDSGARAEVKDAAEIGPASASLRKDDPRSHHPLYPSAESPLIYCSPIRISRPFPLQRKSLALMSGGSTLSPMRMASAT